MKKSILLLIVLMMLGGLLALTGCAKSTESEDQNDSSAVVSMKVTSTGIVNGIIDDKYGKRGTQFNEKGMPTYSLPFKIENAPENTVSYAIVLEDKDAYPVSGGFSWVHWTAANITRTEIMENESQTATDFVQGVNSWTSIQGGNKALNFPAFTEGWHRLMLLMYMSCMCMLWIQSRILKKDFI